MTNDFKRFKYIFKSFSFFFSFSKKNYDIVFYYPVHFNRGKNGENLFFEPFYEICNKNGLKYLIIEEPVLFSKSKYHRNENAVPFDLILIFILILRKIISLKKFSSFEDREHYIGNIIKKIFFKKIKFNNIITMSNSMVGIFRGIDNTINLYDYQHGVIHSKHHGYIKNKKAAFHIKKNNVKVLVYGEGFKQILEKNTLDNYYKQNSIVIGKKLSQININNKINNKIILFTLQLMSTDHSIEIIQESKNIIENFLNQNKSFFEKNDITLIFKPHPRCDKKDIPKEWEKKFSFVYFSNSSLEELLNKSFLHITFSSSTVFEASERKIPTLFLKTHFKNSLNSEYYFREFNYPIQSLESHMIKKSINEYFIKKEKYTEDSNKVFEWFKFYFQNINEKRFVDLIKKGKDE